MYSNLKKIAVASIVVLVTGCASFQAHNLPMVKEAEYKVMAPQKTKVFSRWKVETTSTIVNRDAAAAVYKSAFEKELKESGCCDLVEGPTEAQLVIDGTAIDHSNAGALIPAFITGLSLYTIPSWATQTIDIKVNVKSGDKTHDYQLNDSFKLVQWLPMMFAFPFTGGPIVNGQQLSTNTYRNLIVQLKRDGYF